MVSRRQSRAASYLLLAVGLVLVGLALRYSHLMRLPFSWLEAFDLNLSHHVLEGRLFGFPFEIKKWLTAPLRALILKPSGPEGPWLVRMFSALLSALSIASSVALGRRLKGQKTGLVAGLLYATFPMAVFFERTALTDVLLATLSTLATLLMVWLAYRPRWLEAVLLGIVLGAAYLTKVTALPYLALPGLAILLFTRPHSRWRATAYLGLALAIALGLILMTYQQYAYFTPARDTGWSLVALQLTKLSVSAGGLEHRLAQIGQQLGDLLEIIRYYLTWRLAVWMVLAVWWLIVDVSRRSLSFLVAVASLVVALPVLSSTDYDRDPYLASRYLVPAILPLMVVAAISLQNGLEWIAWRRARLALFGWMVSLTILIEPALLFDVILPYQPERVHIPTRDRLDFLSQPGSNALQRFGPVLRAAWAEADGREMLILANGMLLELRTGIGPRISFVDEYRPDDLDQRRLIAGWLADGGPVFLVLEQRSDLMSDVADLQLAQLATYTHGDGLKVIGLYRMAGARGGLADDIYAYQSPEPSRLEADYMALDDFLTTIGYPSRLLFFPANHAGAFGKQAEPLSIPLWPASSEATDAAVQAFAPGDMAASVGVVLVDEANTDPERLIWLALQRRLYRHQEAWFGLLHYVEWIGGPADPDISRIGGQFEGGIELVRGGVVNASAIRQGDMLRIVLVWQTPTPIQDSFAVFIHAFGAGETLLAQHDSIPGGGLLPMTAWQPGKLIVDRVALRLPADAPPGEIEIRVGIYQPASGFRLAVISGQDSGPDYVVLQRLTIAPGVP